MVDPTVSDTAELLSLDTGEEDVPIRVNLRTL